MAKLKVPERYRAGVAKISTLDAQSVTKLREAIEQLSFTAKPMALGYALASIMPDAEAKGFSKIADTIGVLYLIKSARDRTTDQFAEDVCSAMEEIEEPGLRLKPAELATLKENLIALLGVEWFGITAKAIDLQTDDEHTFCSSRILTDIRPVFGTEIGNGPQGVVLVHILKLGYHQTGAGKHEDFYVSLDAEDLRSLRDTIDRAERKARNLKDTVKDFRFLGLS